MWEILPGSTQFLIHISLSFFLYEPYYFNYSYDVVALSFIPQGKGAKAVNSVKCVSLHCLQIAFRRSVLNQIYIKPDTYCGRDHKRQVLLLGVYRLKPK